MAALVVVGLDLFVAGRQASWLRAGVGPSSVLGWYGVRALLPLASLAALLAARRTTPGVHGLLGPAPPGGLRAVAGLGAAAVGAYLLLLGVSVALVRAGWMSLAGAPRDLRTLGDLAEAAPIAFVAAPLVEELVYRAWAVPALAALAGPRGAVALSGPLFLLLHVAYGHPPWLLHYVVAGCLLSWAFLRSGRLWVAVVLHALGNVLMLLDDLAALLAPDLVRALLGPGAGPWLG